MVRDVLNEVDEATDVASVMLRGEFHAETDDQDDESVVLRLRGELDMATAPRMARALNAALDRRPTAVTIDLSRLAFVDSTGIRVLITAARRARNEGCSLILRAPNRSVNKVLLLTGLDQLIVIESAPPLT
jgi:anti-anti-sigma factor